MGSDSREGRTLRTDTETVGAHLIGVVPVPSDLR